MEVEEAANRYHGPGLSSHIQLEHVIVGWGNGEGSEDLHSASILAAVQLATLLDNFVEFPVPHVWRLDTSLTDLLSLASQSSGLLSTANDQWLALGICGR